jgi:tRNA-dihydrouridine synthase B
MKNMNLLHPLKIGALEFPNNLILAPMAGITDQPFRQLCREMGAGMTVSEMVASDPGLRTSKKSLQRTQHLNEEQPICVQIVGNNPQQMANAAAYNVSRGAALIDINMGCPAKKVYRKQAGSALLGNEDLVRSILQAVVNAVDVPVTLKIRTGLSQNERNGVQIATIAQDTGIQAIAVHGRTRADRFNGEAEYLTIQDICRAVDIPVLANGDIDSPQKAADVLALTGADGIMIGRAAQGRPWIFKEIIDFLKHSQPAPPPSTREINSIMIKHVKSLHQFYGEISGVRIARKHIGWYLGTRKNGIAASKIINIIDSATSQLEALETHLNSPHIKQVA